MTATSTTLVVPKTLGLTGARDRAGAITLTRYLAFLVVGTGVFTAFFGLADYRVLTDHEAYVAVTAGEMLASGDWIVPTFGGVPRLQKPPLAYWLAAGLGTLFGRVDAWVVRLPTVLAMLGLALLMSHWAGRRFGRSAAIAAGAIQLTIGYVLSFGRKAEVDLLLCLLVTSALYLAANQPRDERGLGARRRWLAIHTLVGLSFLCKFHYGPAMVYGPIVAFHLFQRRPSRLLPALHPSGLLVLIGFVVIWPAMVIARAPEAATVWWHETVHRALPGVFEDQPWWFYGPHLISMTMPWTPLALLAVGRCWRRAWRHGNAHDRLLWVTFVVQMAVLAASSNKHRHYVMSALPVFTLLAAETVARLVRVRRTTNAPVISARIALPVTVVTAAIAWFGVDRAIDRWPHLEASFDMVATIGVLTVLGVVWLLAFRRETAAITAGIAGFVVLFAMLQTWVLPGTDHRREPADFARAVRAEVGPRVPICLHAIGRNSVLYHLGIPTRRADTMESVRTAVASGTSHVVLPTDAAPAIVAEHGGRVVAIPDVPDCGLVLVEVTAGQLGDSGGNELR